VLWFKKARDSGLDSILQEGRVGYLLREGGREGRGHAKAFSMNEMRSGGRREERQ
jgi:hypothetical protein